MKYVKTLSAALLLSTCANPAPAETPCDYESQVNTEYTKKIEKVLEFDKKVYPYVEDTRKCVINMSVIIDGVTHNTMGDFVFGPDISENSACKNAENRAKEMIIRKVSPEVLSANTDMKCTVKTKEVVKVEKKVESIKVEPIKETIVVQKIPKIGTVINSEIVGVIKMKPKVTSISDYRNNVLGNNSSIQLNAFAEQGLLTGLALEIVRWIH